MPDRSSRMPAVVLPTTAQGGDPQRAVEARVGDILLEERLQDSRGVRSPRRYRGALPRLVNVLANLRDLLLTALMFGIEGVL